jgi:diguanylate cyclase (GGDEF)-like protein
MSLPKRERISHDASSPGAILLDLQTYMLIAGVGNLCFAALMATYARGSVAQPALRMWMWARIVLGMGQVASWINLHVESSAFAQVIALGWFVGAALEVAAYCLFFRFSRWRRVLYPATALSLAVVVIAQLRRTSAMHMIPIISVVVALFVGAMALILLWPRAGKPALQRIIGINDAVLAIAILAWVWSGAGRDGAPSMGSAAIQSFAFMAGYMSMIVKGFGFLLLCKLEDDRKMLHLATIDSLTGLFNRYAFFDRAQALRLRPAGAAHMSLLMLDLDHFKRINDRFGHAGGDDALCRFAHVVQTVLAGRGVMGRLGGEEFALALALPFSEALQLAERLRAAVTAAPLSTARGPCTVTVSIGVAVLGEGEELASGLARADHALYDAKHGGRNRVASIESEVEYVRNWRVDSEDKQEGALQQVCA